MSVMTERGLGLPAAEPQEVRPVTVSPHRPSVSVATVLERAALYIEEFGFTQGLRGTTSGREGPFCAVGALARASGVPVGFWDGRDARDVDTAYRMLGEIVGRSIVARWNDAPGRTAAEVTAALREAARRARLAGEAIPSTPSTSSPRTAKQTQKES